jgi:hypothetical protein
MPARSKRRSNRLVYLVIALSIITLVLVAVFKRRTPPITMQTEKVAPEKMITGRLTAQIPGADLRG